MFVGCMTELTAQQLAYVVGAADTFGRCGPGDKLQGLLGNIYTPECKAHDQAVRDARKQGSSYLGAQMKALPKLPAAVRSYFRARFG
jgi:hypothetical protein